MHHLALALVLGAAPAAAADFEIAAGDVAALAAAITTANGNGVADTIDLAAGATYGLTAVNSTPAWGANGLPVITSPITIQGNGATLERSASAVANFRHFGIDGGGHLTLNDLTLRNGTTSGATAGGSVHVRSGTLTANDATFTNNHCSGVCLGGAIHLQSNDSVVELRDSILSENSSAEGGAIDVFANGTLTLTRVAVVGNVVMREPSLVDGGGIAASGVATITIVDSTISGNQAIGPSAFVGALGGGLSDQSGATWVIDRTTIADNTVSPTVNDASGGGIYEGGAANFTIRNSTISGNHATTIETNVFDACAGAGIEAEGGGTWTLNNVTISGNTITATMGANARGAGIGIIDVASMTISNSIIAGNTGAAGAPDCFTLDAETLTSGGHLLIEDPTGCTITAGTGDISGEDPLLGVLGPNGGPTFTQALLPGSPALEAGDPATPGSGGTACEAVDQRGLCRPGGARCDIGAFELNGIACATSTTTSTASTTIVVGTTTTTTLPDDCGVPAATFASIICRLARLVAEVEASDDLGRLERGLERAVGKALTKAREAETRAGAGNTRKANKSLKKARQRLRGFIHKVSSLSGRKLLPDETRSGFRAAGDPLVVDLKTLRGTL